MFEFAVEGGFPDAQEAGGPGAVAAGQGEHEADVIGFDFAEGAGRVGGGGCGRWRGVAEGEEVRGDEAVVREHGGMFEGVFQFADVAWPRVSEEGVEAGGGQSETGESEALGALADEVPGQGEDVVGSLAEGWDRDLDDIEAVEEVVSEPALGDALREVLVGGGEHADVDLAGLAFADAADFAVLEGAEEFGLDGGGDVADFIEEEGAAFGFFEEAAVGADGAGEGAEAVSEEFAFEQVFGQGGAIDGEEGVMGAGRAGVDIAGDDLFAGAGFAGEEDGGIEAGDAVGEGEGAAEGGAAEVPGGEAWDEGVLVWRGGLGGWGVAMGLEFAGEAFDDALEVGGGEVFEEGLDFGSPGLEIAAFEAAFGGFLGLALAFDEVDIVAEAMGGEAADVADEGPADGAGHAADDGLVLFAFGGVAPLGGEGDPAGGEVELVDGEFGFGEALDAEEHGGGAEEFFGAFPAEEPLDGGGVGLSPEEPLAGEDAAGGLPAQHFDEVAAELGEGVEIVEDETAPVEADAAGLEFEEFPDIEVAGFHGVAFILIGSPIVTRGWRVIKWWGGRVSGWEGWGREVVGGWQAVCSGWADGESARG